VGKGLERDPDTIPPIERGEPMPPEAQAVVDLLRVLLKATAGRHGVATKLIATSDELEEIARSGEPDVPVLRGWRRKLFGEDALALKRGELALAIKQGEVAVIAPDGSAAADKPKDEA
jgi:ribonuclease D